MFRPISSPPLTEAAVVSSRREAVLRRGESRFTAARGGRGETGNEWGDSLRHLGAEQMLERHLLQSQSNYFNVCLLLLAEKTSSKTC